MMNKTLCLSLVLSVCAPLTFAMDEAYAGIGYRVTSEGDELVVDPAARVSFVRNEQNSRFVDDPQFDLTDAEESQMAEIMKRFGIDQDVTEGLPEDLIPNSTSEFVEAVVKENANIARKIIGGNKEVLKDPYTSHEEATRLAREIEQFGAALKKAGQPL